MELLGKKCIGSLGRIVIPSEIRTRWGLKPNTTIEIHLNGDLLILRKAGIQCALCGGAINNTSDCVKFDVKSNESLNEEIILCGPCYRFLWRKFKEDETREKIQMHVEGGINNGRKTDRKGN